MIRTQGLRFDVDPDGAEGAKLGQVTLDDGGVLDPQASYDLCSWGLDQPGPDGAPVAEVIADFLRGDGPEPQVPVTPD